MSSISMLHPVEPKPRASGSIQGSGWAYWRSVWAAWCPTCGQETMPFPSGRCGFCDTHLGGQATRAVGEPVLRGGDFVSIATSELAA